MLSTLHACSNLGVKNDLELFTLPPTQFSHEGEKFIEYHPSSLKPQESDTIEFNISNTGEQYLDPSSIFFQVRGRIVRTDGTVTVELPDDNATWDATTPKPDQVYPCDNFINSFMKYCDIYLNGKLITSHELYAYRSYVDLLLNARNDYMLWPLMFEPNVADQVLDLKNPRGITKRYKWTAASKEIDMETPLFTDLAQQGMLLLPGVDMRIVIRQNPDSFRINTSPAKEDRTYKFDISRFKLRARFVKIAPSVRLAHESALSKKPALYLLRGVETKIRSLPERSADIILENLCPRRVPARITILFILTEAFYGSHQYDPLKFEHLQIKKSTLYVGGKERKEEFDFDKGFFASAFINFTRAMGNPHNWKFTKAVYEQNFFMLHYILSPDCGTEHLSPIQVDNVRLQIELSKPLSKSYTCIIMTDTPRVIEVSKDRNIEIR